MIEVGFTDPNPFSVIVTVFAFPPKVFPETVTGLIPHVLPFVLLRKSVGPLTQSHETVKLLPVVEQPDALRTII